MTRRRKIRNTSVVLVAICATVILGYLNRVWIRDVYGRVTAPKLPPAEAYKGPVVATSTKPTAAKPATKPAPKPAPPVFAPTSTASLPVEKRLAVPFLVQAPFASWDAIHDEACEEAAVIMVRAYYQGMTGRIDPKEGDRLILESVDYQNEHFGFFQDTSASETKRFLEGLYPELKADVVPMTGAESIKRYIAQGVPVILPADGKALKNPNFRNGGPPYHMLVVRGYTADRFITNDPGTRNGENYLYPIDVLVNAVRDWNEGDVKNGGRVMLIVRPH